MQTQTRTTTKRAVQKPAQPLSDDDKAIVAAVCAHNRFALEKIRPVFDLTILDATEKGLRIFFSCLFEYFDARNALPFEEELQAAILRYFDDGDRELDEDEVSQVETLMHYVYGKPERAQRCRVSDQLMNTAVRITKNWMMTRNSVNLADILFKRQNAPELTEEALQQYEEKQSRIRTLDTPSLRPLFEGDWGTEVNKPLISIGSPSLDRVLDGGMSGGELLLFMGPYGSCKTMLAHMSACNMAKDCADLAARGQVRRDANGIPMIPSVCLVTVEAARDEVQMRAVSYLSGIPYKRIREGFATLRTPEDQQKLSFFHDNDKPTEEYEIAEQDFQRILAAANENNNQRLLHEQYQVYQSERKRLRYAIELLRRYVLFIELVGSNEQLRSFGAGGIRDVAEIIKNELRIHRNRYLYSIVLDHASALMNRIIEKGGGTLEQSRDILKSIPRQMTEMICKPYNIPGLLLHQLSGAANAKALSPTRALHHTDAADCKSIGEYADFAAQTSFPTSDDRRLCVWHVTKYRRTPPSRPVITSVDGKFMRIIDRSHDMTIDGDEIVAIADQLQRAPR